MSVRPVGPQAKWRPMLTGNGYMGISLNSRNHTGAAFAEIVDWIGCNTTFNEFRIGLSDTLNRHNYMMEGLSYADATEKAQRAGDEWLKENASVMSGLPHAKVIRWESWHQDAEAIAQNKRKYMTAYHTDPVFRDAVNEDINAFFARRGQGLANDFAQAQHSLDYLIEELAVYEEIFRDYPCTTIYPGKQLKCFEVIRSGQVPGLSETIGGSQFLRLNVNVSQRAPGMAA